MITKNLPRFDKDSRGFTQSFGSNVHKISLSWRSELAMIGRRSRAGWFRVDAIHSGWHHTYTHTLPQHVQTVSDDFGRPEEHTNLAIAPSAEVITENGMFALSSVLTSEALSIGCSAGNSFASLVTANMSYYRSALRNQRLQGSQRGEQFNERATAKFNEALAFCKEEDDSGTGSLLLLPWFGNGAPSVHCIWCPPACQFVASALNKAHDTVSGTGSVLSRFHNSWRRQWVTDGVMFKHSGRKPLGKVKCSNTMASPCRVFCGCFCYDLIHKLFPDSLQNQLADNYLRSAATTVLS